MRLVLNHKNQKQDEVTVFNFEDNTLFIYDYIGSYKWNDDTTVTANSFLNELKKVKGDLTVRINSKGGEVGNALAIYQMLKEHNGKVTCVVDGYAYSSASWIMLAGEERTINTGGLVMVHNPMMYALIDAENALDKIMPQWLAHRDSINMIISERTGLKSKEVTDMMNAETYLNSKQAIEKGFCHAIANKPANIPDQIKNQLPDELKKTIPVVDNSERDALLRRSLVNRSKNLNFTIDKQR